MTDCFCACLQFVLWYVDETTEAKFCTCGHSDADHLDAIASCVGDVTVYQGVRHGV
jgi:hypothetical protein